MFTWPRVVSPVSTANVSQPQILRNINSAEASKSNESVDAGRGDVVCVAWWSVVAVDVQFCIGQIYPVILLLSHVLSVE